MKLHSEVELIDPARAAEYLLANCANRPLSPTTVERYAQQMKRGLWRLNGEGIIFDRDGNMIQGQHRMHAIIKSGISQSMLVVRGVETEAFETLDTGLKRSPADVLSLAGIRGDNRRLAAGIRACFTAAWWAKIPDVPSWRALSNHDYLRFAEKNPDIIEWTKEFKSHRECSKIYPSSFIGPIYVLSLVRGHEFAELFLSRAVSGQMIGHGDPEYTIRERFLRSQSGVSMGSDFALALLIKSVNAAATGKAMKIAKHAIDESNPRLVGIEKATFS